MKRMMGSLMLMLMLLGVGTAREAMAQAAPQAPELISFVSFIAYPRWNPTEPVGGVVASTYTVIASLSSYRTEVYQVQLFALGSLTSYKLRTASGWENNYDRTPWLPVPLISQTSSGDAVSAGGYGGVLPFSQSLWVIPAATGISTPAAQQYWMRLESSQRLVVDFRGGGDNVVVGFARYRYVPLSKMR